MNTEEQVIDVINRIRPYLNNDGGDIEFVKFDNGIVYVRLIGACAGCAMQDATLKDGLEALLLEEVPGVIEVVNVAESNEEIK
ncbi:MAG: NifU family protein [Acholeplasmatales bacterium]|nr:NifU family protein [Acholeplasmatales bacterium]